MTDEAGATPPQVVRRLNVIIQKSAGVVLLRFSIITPNLNLSKYLPRTVESVLCNLSPGDEYFVIDGGSTDGSIGIIRQYESRLTGWISEPDQGYADALAKGFGRATGDILCWINSGDLLLPGALDAARQALTDTRADMLFGDDFYIDEEGRVIRFSRGYVKDLRDAMLYGGGRRFRMRAFGGVSCMSAWAV